MSLKRCSLILSAAGALALRQDIRLLPHLFDVCIHEYADLAHKGWVPGRGIDHFLCHYSSERFIPVVRRADGKVLKPDGWQAADKLSVIRAALP